MKWGVIYREEKDKSTHPDCPLTTRGEIRLIES